MKITFINVGYGDAIYIENNEKTLLIDGGSSLESEFFGFPARVRAAAYLRKMGVKKIDDLIISHIHEDHVCGLTDIVKHIEIGNVYTPYPVEAFSFKDKIEVDPGAKNSVILYTKALNDFINILSNLKNKGAKINRLSPGEHLDNCAVHIEALAPKAELLDKYMSLILKLNTDGADNTELLTMLDATSNGTSLLLKIKEPDVSVLLCADCVPDLWNEVDKSVFNDISILKLPHHGQADSVKEEYLKLMPLKTVITTSASDRRYNSANPMVYDKIREICGEKTEFIFSDETEYLPYFKAEKPFNAFWVDTNENVPNSGIKVGFEYFW